MKHSVHDIIAEKKSKGEHIFALLIDPDKFDLTGKNPIIEQIETTPPDLILVGGSQCENSIEKSVIKLRQHTTTPIVMFPGNCKQFSPLADGILFLSLLSGRNPKWLVEQQIESARQVRQSQIEVIPTGYILVDGGRRSAVEKVSGTQAYPKDNIALITDTAIAAELMGNHIVYLEAGSGALTPVPYSVIQSVRKAISIPLIVGGGIKTENDIHNAIAAGADIIVVGNHLESNPGDMGMMVKATKQQKTIK